MARQGEGVDLSESIKDLAEVSKPLKLQENVEGYPPTPGLRLFCFQVPGQNRPKTQDLCTIQITFSSTAVSKSDSGHDFSSYLPSALRIRVHVERYNYRCWIHARSAGEQKLSSLRLRSKNTGLDSGECSGLPPPARVLARRAFCGLCASLLVPPGGTPALSSLQPLESAEFRLRVSNSVEPSAMYAKTLEATEVSPYGFEEL